MEMKGRADGADSVTLTIDEGNGGCNSPHRFRLALVTVEGDRVSHPVYVSSVDWGCLAMAAARSPRTFSSCWRLGGRPIDRQWHATAKSDPREPGPNAEPLYKIRSSSWLDDSIR